jgi:ATP phosphoribosyltransferase regulatory subunit
MTEAEDRALLPEGLHDTLPPKAEFEASTIAGLLHVFGTHGYEQVAPPLVEFEESLLAGVGAAESRRMFRLMDPVASRMMGVRTDITVQVARIATTRLAAAPRPLRLCYAGQVLRVSSGKMRSEREFGQAGIEIVGTASAAAEAEVLLLAADALKNAGVDDLTVDLTVPSLVPMICESLGIDEDTASGIREALNDKDMAALSAMDGAHAELFDALLRAAGESDRALDRLGGLDLTGSASELVDGLAALVGVLKTEAPDLGITIDPGEYRGFEYHSGICFTFYARRTSGELGRGGRYEVHGSDAREPAVGATIYVDSLLRALPEPESAQTVFVPAGASRSSAQALRDAGLRTVQGLDQVDDIAVEARRLGCSHVFRDGEVEEV